MKHLLIIFILLCWQSTANAVDLLGIDLATAQPEAMRVVLKKAGLIVLRESSDDQFFDSYESEGLFPGSAILHLGFVNQDRRFAFAEYEFIGLQRPGLIKKLVEKYGQYKKQKGKFVTDASYQWDKGTIQITLYSDWKNYRTRLIYAQPEALNTLLGEYGDMQEKSLQNGNNSQIGAY